MSLENLERDIQARADARSFDVLIRLLDILKAEFKADLAKSTSDMLIAYVSIKLLRHRIKKRIRDGWYVTDEQEQLLQRKFTELTFDVKEARRKYYESKRRNEERQQSGV